MNYEYDDVTSVKAFESTPVKFRINEDPESASKAIKLVNVVMSRFKIAKTDNIIEFEVPPYETHEKLIKDGLIKVYAKNLDTNKKLTEEDSLTMYNDVKEIAEAEVEAEAEEKEQVEETPVEEKVEETPVEEPVEEKVEETPVPEPVKETTVTTVVTTFDTTNIEETLKQIMGELQNIKL